MSTPTDTLIGPCADCGTPVERDRINGPFAEHLNRMPFRCDGCSRIQEERLEQEEEQRAAERHREAAALRVHASGLPISHQAYRLKDLEHSDRVLSAANEWVNTGCGLLLTGAVGRGKTTIAGACALELLDRQRVIWTSAPLLFARLGSGWDTDSRALALDTLTSNVALVLDDIDKARPTEYAAEQVFVAIDQRVEHRVPLLVTSNLSPASLAERWPAPYGEAIASRLVGYCTVVRVEGVDRRLAE